MDVFIFGLVDHHESAGFSLAARLRKKLKNWLIPSIGNTPISFSNNFNVEWPDRAMYHAMMNTSIGDETVLQMVLI